MFQWIRRIALFLALNFAVMISISILLNFVLPLFGIRFDPATNLGLLGFCFVWGMGGAFVSLLLSKIMAKWSMGVKIIEPHTASGQERELLMMVEHLAQTAGLRKSPEVGIYESPDPNAFATGPTRNNSLVAVSTGLLRNMSREEVEGVLAHEVAHIANGDMVTMTLIQGVVNAFVMFLSRIIARSIATDKDGRTSTGTYYFATFIIENILFVFGMIIVAAFSRRREFRADYGGASYAGRQKMVAGLRRLQQMYPQLEPESGNNMATMKISSKGGGFLQLFSTHPRLEDRIARLQEASDLR